MSKTIRGACPCLSSASDLAMFFSYTAKQKKKKKHLLEEIGQLSQPGSTRVSLLLAHHGITSTKQPSFHLHSTLCCEISSFQLLLKIIFHVVAKFGTMRLGHNTICFFHLPRCSCGGQRGTWKDAGHLSGNNSVPVELSSPVSC